MMLAFDMPHPEVTVEPAERSNVPAQALIMLNDPLVAELGRRLGSASCWSIQDAAPRDRIGRHVSRSAGPRAG